MFLILAYLSGSCLVGEPAPHEEVAPVAVRDLYQLAFFADLSDILFKNNFHIYFPLSLIRLRKSYHMSKTPTIERTYETGAKNSPKHTARHLTARLTL